MSSGNSEVGSDPIIEKSQVVKHDHYDGDQTIEAKEKLPGQEDYYNDGQDHAHEPPVCSSTKHVESKRS